MKKTTASLVTSFTAGLTAFIGLTVLFGWHTHNLQLLRIHPSFVAMAYNAAMGFFLCGLSLLALALRRPRLALVGGAYGILCGSLTLGEYLFHCDFHIDELVMRAYITAGIVNNARMSFNTSLCFLLMGLFLCLSAQKTKSRWMPCVAVLLASLTLGMGLIAMTGYLFGVQNYYAWGQFTRMALHTAICFILLGTGSLACVRQNDADKRFLTLRWLPLPVGVGVLALTVSLWQALVVEQGIQADWLRRVAGGAALPKSLFLMNTFVAQAALGIGLLFALMLASLVFLAQAGHEKALALGSVNGELVEQVQVRRDTEAALALVNDTLENRVQERTAEIDALNQRLRRAMAETHHRVKNNLQVIAALVDMQTMEGTDTVPMREMERLGHHIASLALIHDLLTHQAKTDDYVADIDMRDAVQKLIPLLQVMMPDRVLRVNAAAMRLAVRPGASLTILINELVSNAGKHGKGAIEVDLTQDGVKGRLTVRDHGPGFPPGFNPRKAANTGLDLIQSLTEWDLKGTCAFENADGGGGRVAIVFPLLTPQEPFSELPTLS